MRRWLVGRPVRQPPSSATEARHHHRSPCRCRSSDRPALTASSSRPRHPGERRGRPRQLQLEDTLVRVEAAPGKKGGFAYWVDPEWTGARADERRVTIVAAPGVRVRTGAPAHAPVITYGRRLTTEIVRVPHPGLVPAQGSRFSLNQFVGVESVGGREEQQLPITVLGPLDPDAESSDTVHVGTGLSGVTIEHPWSEARVTLRPSDPAVGAAYARQVQPPVNGQPGEIRVVAGHG